MKHPWQALIIGWMVAGWTMASCMRSERHQFIPELAAPDSGAVVAAATATPTPQVQPLSQSQPPKSNVPLASETELSTDNERNDITQDTSGAKEPDSNKAQTESYNDEETNLIVDGDHPLVGGLEIQSKYFPLLRNQGENRKFRTITGIVSYVDDEQHTKSGKRFYPDQMVGAHKHWPMGTVVKCTNLSNDKSAVVQIIDRGPYVDGRVLDLSEAAGRKIGILHKGITKCRVEVLAYPRKSK